jgi:predicted metal-dependent hydrolase
MTGMSRLDRTLPFVFTPADDASLLSYRVRRSDRARRVRVTVDRGGVVEVVLPRRAPERAAAEAVRELRPWIDRRLAEVGRQQAAVLARGDTLPYLGQSLTVHAQPGRSRVTRRGDMLLVPLGPQRLAAIERWYRQRARAEIQPRLDRACALTGLSYARLSIRDQRTRWGSCSRAGAISFNWRLLMAPEAVLDYVIWHEVCHLSVMDHSPRFWALVARHCPDHRAHSAWLRRNSGTLVL